MRAIQLLSYIVVVMLIGTLFLSTTHAKITGAPVLVSHIVWDDGGDEYGYSITQTNDSGYVIVGSGHEDLLIVKFNADGNFEWKKYIDAGSTLERLLSVTTDDDGYIISVGFKANLTIDKDDFVMIKMDIWGNIIWENITNDNNPNGAFSVIFDPVDKTYVVAGKWGTSQARAHIWKFDKNGNLIWDKDVSRNDYGWNTLTNIAIYNSTTYCVYGYGDGPTGTKDVFFELVNRQNGDVLKSYTFGSPDYRDTPNGIVCDSSGYIYAASEISYSYTKVYKFDSNGNNLWNRTITSSYKNSLHVSSNGQYLLLGGYNKYSDGSAEVGLSAISFDNGTLWTHNESITGKDYIKSVGWFTSKDFYLVGNTTANNDDILLVHYTLDTEPPSLSITSPKNGTYTNKTEVLVTWEGKDNYNIDYYEVSDGGNRWINVGLSKSYTFTSLSEGIHRLYVKAVDAGENECIHYIKIIVDYTPPTLSFIKLKDGEYINTKNFDVSWNVYDPNIRFVNLKLDNGNWINVTNVNSYPLNLSEGLHIIYLVAEDFAGNKNITAIHITIDTEVPLLQAFPLNEYLNKTRVMISWNGSDNYGIKYYEVSIDNSTWKNIGNDTNITLNLKDGKHTIKIKAIDYASNINITMESFYIDTKPPWITNFHVMQEGNKIKISWNSKDNLTGIDYYLIKVDASSWKNINDNSTYLNNLAPGKHKITIRAYDNAGNYVEKTYIFEVKPTTQISLLFIIAIIVSLIVIGLLVLWIIKKRGKEDQSDNT